jgi:trans-2,3-dihydro-3-hydroxyanthranilate isomerase
MKFYIVDVFAETKYAGNQLAVFTGQDVANLSPDEMLQIAREINYSETTFIISDKPTNGGYDVRIFTPAKELPFAGHPTLGTAYIIQKEIIKNSVERVILNLKVGQIPVSWETTDDLGEVLWMKQNTPTFHQKYDAESLAAALNLETADIDSRFPIQEVSTGIPFIIVPLKSHQALKKSKVNLDKLLSINPVFSKNPRNQVFPEQPRNQVFPEQPRNQVFSKNLVSKNATEILIFCPETNNSGNDLSVRMFAPALGITEDPATGSANGCLAGYLVEYNYFGEEKIEVKVEQGYEINRPSLLLLKAEKRGGEIEVFVGGKVVMVARGEFV